MTKRKQYERMCRELDAYYNEEFVPSDESTEETVRRLFAGLCPDSSWGDPSDVVRGRWLEHAKSCLQAVDYESRTRHAINQAAAALGTGPQAVDPEGA